MHLFIPENYVTKPQKSSKFRTYIAVKGGFSDDVIIFNCFRVIFSLKKKTIQFSLSFNLYFQQKIATKLSICH